MATAVVLPRQGQSVESCIITKWHKSPGEKVSEGDLLFSYETDKAAFEEEARESGVLLEIFFREGEEVPVLENVAVIGMPGENYMGLKPSSAVAAPSENESVKENGQQPDDQSGSFQAIAASPGGRIRISPLARKKALELNLPAERIKGTGPAGRIIKRDVLLAAEGIRKEETVKEHTGTRADAFTGNDFTSVSLSGIRKLIADRMAASLKGSAQLTHHITADARQILAWRKEIKSAGTGSTGITINDMVCHAVIRALKKHSYHECPLSWDDSIKSSRKRPSWYGSRYRAGTDGSGYKECG
jgi:pyruvate dehydrogenase E2 component (dihydrolipoamide acetyltransferase)